MNESILSFRNIDPEAISVSSASRLLRLGFAGPRRPIDDLIDRLSLPDGHGWLQNALTLQFGIGPDEIEDSLCRGNATLASTEQLKELGKKAIAQHATAESRMAAIAMYFLAVAAALVHHKRLIASRPREEVNDALLDLASAAPEPWAKLLGEAAVAGTG
jgi:hypothetical protein